MARDITLEDATTGVVGAAEDISKKFIQVAREITEHAVNAVVGLEKAINSVAKHLPGESLTVKIVFEAGVEKDLTRIADALTEIAQELPKLDFTGGQ